MPSLSDLRIEGKIVPVMMHVGRSTERVLGATLDLSHSLCVFLVAFLSFWLLHACTPSSTLYSPSPKMPTGSFRPWAVVFHFEFVFYFTEVTLRSSLFLTYPDYTYTSRKYSLCRHQLKTHITRYRSTQSHVISHWLTSWSREREEMEYTRQLWRDTWTNWNTSFFPAITSLSL